MRLLVITVAVAAVLPQVVTAQTDSAWSEAPQIIHITDRLKRFNISRKALDDFAEAKLSSDRSAAKSGAPAHKVGDTRTFKVYNHRDTEQNGRFVLESRDFIARAVDARFVIWVEAAEIENGHVRERDVADLAESMSERTPYLSIDPSAGILDNNERIFGVPADVDGDGAVNVLLVDIRDNWEPGSKAGYVAGFVWSGDLTRAGNESDIVYLDTYPGLYRNGGHVATTGMETTLAHEYLHLIHLNYDANEHTFVDEGLAEWASVMNGYAPRSITYLNDAQEHNVSLFHWRRGTDVVNDYQRAGLFTAYLAARMGPESTGSILRQNVGHRVLRGAEGYESALATASLSLEEILSDFHIANLLDGATGNEDFYRHSSFVGADPTFQYDASAPGVTSLQDIPLNPGAVQYFQWNNASHLDVDVDINTRAVAGSLIPMQRDRVSARLIIERMDGSISRIPVELGLEMKLMDESAQRVTLVLVHHAPDDYGVRLDVNASWGLAATGVGPEDNELPGLIRLEQNYPNPFNPQTFVRYTLENAGPTRLTIFDGLGRTIARVVDGHHQKGEHEIVFDASGWPSGTYVYTLESRGHTVSRKMTLLR